MTIHPVTFVWRDVDVVDEHGEVRSRKAMVPLPRFGNICGRQFHDGEEYSLVPLEERSMASHKAYFAQIGEAFKNLPEKWTTKFPTSEHLRHWALIETHWCDQTDFVCPDELFLKRMIAFHRKNVPYARMTFAPVEGGGFLFCIKIAKSQSMAAMKKDAFESSKRDVLDLLSGMIGVSTATLKKEAGRAA